MDPDFEMGMLLRGNHPMQVQQREQQAERVRSDSQEAVALRKLLSIYNPDRKDEFTYMDLGDLRGESMAHASKVLDARNADLHRKNIQEAQSAEALQQLIGDFGTTQTTSVPTPSAPGLIPTPNRLDVQTRRPLNAANLRAMLPTRPTAAGSPLTIDLLRELQRGDQDQEGGGAPQILPGPFANTRIVTDARGRSTPQVVHEQKDAEGYIEVPDATDPVYGPKIRLPLSQAKKDYPHLLNRLKPGSPAASPYKSADEVKAAVKAGKLPRTDAVDILKKQFGYQ